MDYHLTGNSSSSSRNMASSRFAAFFTLASVILLIVSLATPAILSATGWGRNLRSDVGPFRVCGHLGNKEQCDSVDSECKIDFTILGITTKIPVVDDCDQFNAARAFQVIAAILLGVGLIFQLASILATISGSFIRALGAILGILGAVCGAISMGVWINLREKEFDADGVEYEYGFILLTIGWILGLLASIAFCKR